MQQSASPGFDSRPMQLFFLFLFQLLRCGDAGMKTFERISHMWGSWFRFSEVGLDLKRLARSVLNTNTSAPKQLHFLL